MSSTSRVSWSCKPQSSTSIKCCRTSSRRRSTSRRRSRSSSGRRTSIKMSSHKSIPVSAISRLLNGLNRLGVSIRDYTIEYIAGGIVVIYLSSYIGKSMIPYVKSYFRTAFPTYEVMIHPDFPYCEM